MKRVLMMTVASIVVLCAGLVFAAEKAPQKVVDLAYSTLVNYGTAPEIVEAVKKENAKRKSLSQIKEMDKKWINTPGVVDYMKDLMDSSCGPDIRNIQRSSKMFAEIFVMDDQGANVCMTDKTSDYWQGDEAKFQKSFNNGKGGIDISDVKFDDSSQAYIVQVSVPVKDGDQVIGAITFGIDVDKIQ